MSIFVSPPSLLLSLLLPFLCTSATAEPISSDLMTLYKYYLAKRPTWQYSLANFSTDTNCTCLRLCLVDDRCLSVLFYPNSSATGEGIETGMESTAELPESSGREARTSTNNQKTDDITKTLSNTIRINTDKIPAETTSAFANTPEASINITANVPDAELPVVCQLYETVEDEEIPLPEKPEAPAGAQLCSRLAGKNGPWKDIMGKC